MNWLNQTTMSLIQNCNGKSYNIWSGCLEAERAYSCYYPFAHLWSPKRWIPSKYHIAKQHHLIRFIVNLPRIPRRRPQLPRAHPIPSNHVSPCPTRVHSSSIISAAYSFENCVCPELNSRTGPRRQYPKIEMPTRHFSGLSPRQAFQFISRQ